MKRNIKFEQNLQIIKECDKLFFAELEVFDFSLYEIENAESETAVDGTEIIKVINNKHEWYLNSRYEANKVTKQWISNLGKIETIATIVMFGLGNGSILRELLRKTSESVIFIIYEPSIDIFMRAMLDIDFAFLEERVFIQVEGINDSYFEPICEAAITYENLSVCKFIGHPNYWSCFHQEAKSYLDRLQVVIRYIGINNNTKLMMGEGYYKNALMNMKHLSKVSLLDQIENEVGIEIPGDLPAIIVSAGPSLSKNIKELKRAKGKSFIIATDSALIGLMEEGIVPDAFATVDPLKPLNRFEDQRINEIPLICTESSRYEVLEKHKDRKILANNSFGYGRSFYPQLEIEYKARQSGGSVATFAYMVARIIGFHTIIFVGQDLAFTDETRYYDKVKEWSDHNTLPQSMYLEVEDIHGEKVKTSKDLALYIDWFEKEIKNHPEIETIDATEGGAKIHGSKIMDLNQAINDKCQVQFDMSEYLRNIPACIDEEKKEELNQLIKQVPEEYNDMYQNTLIGIELYTKLIENLEMKMNNNPDMMLITKDIGDITKKIEGNSTYFHIQHKLEKVERMALNNLGVSLENQVEDALQISGRGKQILEALKQILEDEVLQNVKQVIDQIEVES
ncbi:MAG: motility associated factor glycosyltransferase family protein [Lachnotalea sp.]